jgi:hypothetical protein
MNLQRIIEILNHVTFNPFKIKFEWRVLEKGDGFLIQLTSVIPDCEIDNELSEQRGGKHYISSHATDNEVYFKAFKACKDYLDHELHENFYVNDVRLFDPHIDIEDLMNKVQFAKRTSRNGSYYPQQLMQNV